LALSSRRTLFVTVRLRLAPTPPARFHIGTGPNRWFQLAVSPAITAVRILLRIEGHRTRNAPSRNSPPNILRWPLLALPWAWGRRARCIQRASDRAHRAAIASCSPGRHPNRCFMSEAELEQIAARKQKRPQRTATPQQLAHRDLSAGPAGPAFACRRPRGVIRFPHNDDQGPRSAGVSWCGR